MIIPTEDLVTAFRFLVDSKIADVLGFPSIVSIVAGLWNLPPLARPSVGSPHSPYISARRKRRILFTVGIVTAAITFAALWLRFVIPGDIGHAVNPPINAAAFRHQLEWFLVAIGLVLTLQATYWATRLRIGYAK